MSTATKKSKIKQALYFIKYTNNNQLREIISSSKEIDELIVRAKTFRKVDFPITVPISFDGSDLESCSKMSFGEIIIGTVIESITRSVYSVFKNNPELNQIYTEHKELEKDMEKLTKKIYKKLDPDTCHIAHVRNMIYQMCFLETN